ncbi:MAG: hypothetical protein Kow0069_11310 [Promethearchaeota archaeon]
MKEVIVAISETDVFRIGLPDEMEAATDAELIQHAADTLGLDIDTSDFLVNRGEEAIEITKKAA